MIQKLRTLGRYAQAPAGWSRLVQYAVKKPGTAWRRFIRSGSSTWIKEYFENLAEYRSLVQEIEQSDLIRNLRDQLAVKFAEVKGRTARGNPYTPGAMNHFQALNIYALIRKRAPKLVVETGVCNGFSTAIFLAALERNGKGHLYSIDYPEYTGSAQTNAGFWQGKGGAVVPADKESGWLVPGKLRDRWTLILGKSQEKLPALMSDLGRVDFFVHDSEHSLENQLYEFHLAFKHLNTGGILLASDITWSDAFDLFWKTVRPHARRHFIDDNLALVARTESRLIC